MAVHFPQIEELPRKTATQVKNKWSDLVREVRVSGSVAVTHHDMVEMVVVEAGRYREMAALVDSAERRQTDTLAELVAEFDQRLAELRVPDSRQRVEKALASRGRATPRPKAGASF